jgi:N utilization substance protein B
VHEHSAELDEKITAHAHGWKTERLTRVSRSILRLAAYEMLYCEDIPASVSLNEAIELAKKFEDEKARPFINGILNGIKTELGKE